MNIIIDVPASVPYQVEIGKGVLSNLGDRIRSLCPKAEQVIVVSDDNVFPLHGDTAMQSLRRASLAAEPYVLPHGESAKNTQELITLLNFLASRRMTRSDALVALGGGVIGDLTGLAAAVYMRGISYIQCPTTLLASVDSSVGGKTAVDLDAGKNLMGAFWQPKAVLCDTNTLDTLPHSVFTDGCAEVIKTTILFDPPLFASLEHHGFLGSPQHAIAGCVAHKRDIVAEDEFDTGRRALLNLGHTLGHAIEAVTDFSVSHGRAVAIGTAAACRASVRAGLAVDRELSARVNGVLTLFGLPTRTDIPIETLLPAMLSDKKRTGSRVTVVVPERIGRCVLRPMDENELKEFYEMGLKA